MPILSCEQQAQLAAAICATAETLGQTLSASAAEMMASDLAGYPTELIAGALQACRRDLTGKLTLAAIIERLQARDGRPGPDEAWAIALCAYDESDSVVITEEIHVALAAARPVLERGDKIGARMAFKAAYVRVVDAARREAKPVKWTLSLGTDPQRRVAAAEEAGRLGRLPALQVSEHLAQLTHAPVTAEGSTIACLITGNAAPFASAKVREHCAAIKAQLERNAEAAKAKQEAERAAKGEDLKRRKAEATRELADLEARKAR